MQLGTEGARQRGIFASHFAGCQAALSHSAWTCIQICGIGHWQHSGSAESVHREVAVASPDNAPRL